MENLLGSTARPTAWEFMSGKSAWKISMDLTLDF